MLYGIGVAAGGTTKARRVPLATREPTGGARRGSEPAGSGSPSGSGNPALASCASS